MLSLLAMPFGDPDAAEAAIRSGADALVFDVGDPDAPGDRSTRRRAAVEALRRCGVRSPPSFRSPGLVFPGARGPRRHADRPALIVRVAPLASGLLEPDLDAVMAGAPDAVLLPGAVGARDLGHLAAKLAVREAEHGLQPGRTRIAAAAADTAAGVLALSTLPGATPRLLALAWDPAALAADLGASAGSAPLRTARGLLLIAAAASGVPALDHGLASDRIVQACRRARRDGFAGRTARGPDEVAAIAAAFA